MIQNNPLKIYNTQTGLDQVRLDFEPLQGRNVYIDFTSDAGMNAYWGTVRKDQAGNIHLTGCVAPLACVDLSIANLRRVVRGDLTDHGYTEVSIYIDE